MDPIRGDAVWGPDEGLVNAVSSVTEELARQPILATGMPRPLPPPAAPRDPPARGTPFVVIPGREDHAKRLPALSVPSTSGRVHSLQGYCLGTLGCFVDQVVSSLGPDVMYLPPENRAVLLAVAKRRGVLFNAVLMALLDDSWTLLDLAGAKLLSDLAIQRALSQLPLLVSCDLSHTGISKSCLKHLAKVCPRLRLLRLAGCPSINSVAELVLAAVMPRLKTADDTELTDDWEQADDTIGELLPGRFNQLECLIWPDAPPATYRYMAAHCPKIPFNPTAKLAAKRGLPLMWIDANCPLDQELAQVPSVSAWAGLRQTEAEQQQRGLTLAQRFRQAYVEQDVRIQKQQQREWYSQKRREMQHSGSRRLYEQWLDEH